MVELSHRHGAGHVNTVEKLLPAGALWEFPAASVSAVEIPIG